MVEAEFRNVHVSFHPGARYQAKGVQEALFYPAAQKQ
jgi:hypothetical protein